MKSRAASVCALSLGCLAITGSLAAAQSTLVSVRGRALDQDTQRGVPSARIELVPRGTWLLADAEGWWEFRGVEPGTHTIVVTADGYEVTRHTLTVTGPVITDVPLTRRPYRLHESVTVTAVKDEARSYDVPRSITVVDATDLERRLPRTTPEALWDAPGVFVQKTNHGGGSPYLRGMLGNQVLVLVDGIRLNNATFRYGPNQYLATIDPALVERIEVVRGAGSVLYGSDAMGGVINIVSRRPANVGQPRTVGGKVSTKVMTSGMEQSARFEMAATGPTGGVAGGVSLRRFGDLRGGGGLGVEAPSGYEEAAGDLRAEFSWSPRERLTLAYQHHLQSDVPRYDQVAQRGFARYAFDPQVRQLGYLRYERWSTTGWRNVVRATASLNRSTERREYQRRSSSLLTSERDEVLTSGAAIELRSRPRSWLLLVSGLDYYHDAIESTRRDLDEATGGFVDRRGLYPSGAASDSLALFTHASLTGPRWRVDAGLRASRFEVTAPDPIFGSARIAPATTIGSVGALVTLAEGVRLFGSASQGFRAPNVDDLSSLGQFDFGVEVPSPGLRPESSLSIEGGLKLRSAAGAASVSVYRTSLDRLIDRVRGTFDGSPLAGDQEVYQKANVGSAFIKGIEADGEVGLAPSLTLSGFVSYTHGELASRNEPLRRIPPLNGGLALRFGHAAPFWLEGALRFAQTQDRLASGDLADHRIPPGGTPGWTVFNVNAAYRLSPRIELVGGVQNMFDTAYRTHGSGIDGYGRSAWLGMNAGF